MDTAEFSCIRISIFNRQLLIILCRTLDEGTLLEALEERGLIEQVMKSLNLSRESGSTEKPLSPHGGLMKEEGGREEERQEESLASPQYFHHRLSSPPGRVSV